MVKKDKIWGKKEIIEIFHGWNAYAKLANTYKLRKKIKREVIDITQNKQNAS
jgi:hypothetical protein